MCIIYTETPICSFNYLNFYDLNKHGLGCLVPLREVRFTWHRKQDPHICGVPGGPLEQALNTMRSRATLHSLPWSQTHRCIDQFHPQSFPRSSEVEIFFFSEFSEIKSYKILTKLLLEMLLVDTGDGIWFHAFLVMNHLALHCLGWKK